jgi:hypothetical protein
LALKGDKGLLVDAIASLVQAGKRSTTKAELCSAIGMSSRHLNRLLNDLSVERALLDRDILIGSERGEVFFETVAALAEEFDGVS